MPWVKFDDRFDDQDDIDMMSTDAIALNLCATTWSSRNLTDGFIPDARVRRLPGGTPEAVELLCAGEKPWWEKVDGGYQIRSFLKYNPSAEEVRARRETDAERKASSREKRTPSLTDEKSPEACPPVTPCVTPVVTPPVTPERTPHVSPSRVPVSRIPYPGIRNDDDSAGAPEAWWPDHPDDLVREIVLAVLRVPKFAEHGPPEAFRVEKLAGDVRSFAPEDAAIRYELENWETYNRESPKKGGQRDAVAALRNWFANKRGAWSVAKKRDADRAAGRLGRASTGGSIRDRAKEIMGSGSLRDRAQEILGA